LFVNLKMSVDNSLYDRDAHLWWDENSYLNLLRTTLNPARFGYFVDVLKQRGVSLSNITLLDVGSGGGLLAEEFARLGCRVTGIDRSAESVAAARAHANQSILKIEYRVARGEALPYAAASFDLVVCCDVLEHVDDLDRVIAEAGRVLKPGGLYFFDTINRTMPSWLTVIFAAQEFPLTAIFPPRTHSWGQFIKPTELDAVFRKHGLALQEVHGLSPRLNPLHSARLLVLRRLGFLTYRQYGEQAGMRVTSNTSMNYVGYSIKD